MKTSRVGACLALAALVLAALNHGELRAADTAALSSQSTGVGRQREALESYPLDAMYFQGTVDIGGVTYGMVLAPNGMVHRVRAGALIGEHQGRVSSISRQGLSIVEPADAARGVPERRLELGLGTSPNAPPAAQPLAAACEKEVREHASVTAITDRGPTQNGSVSGYRITFRGQPGSMVTAQCWSASNKVTVVYSETEQDDSPKWEEIRQKGVPVGASSCDTRAQRFSFIESLRGTDAKRLVARRAKRAGSALVLQLDNGKQVRLEDDSDECEGDCTRYRFFEWHEATRTYIVYVLGSENAGFMLVDSRDGTQTPSLPGYPVWSPSGRWVAIDAGEGGGYDNVSLLVQEARQSEGKLAFLVPYGAEKFCVISWNSDVSLALRVVKKGRPGELYRQATRHLGFDGLQWRFTD